MNAASSAFAGAPAAIISRAARLAPGRNLVMIVGLDRPVDDGPTGSQRLNLSLALSQRLLDTPRRQIALAVPQALDDLLAGDGPVLVDQIELLFDPLLQIDPLRALKMASRRRRLLALAWPAGRERPPDLRRGGLPRIPALWPRRPGRRSNPGCSRAAPGGVDAHAVPRPGSVRPHRDRDPTSNQRKL